MERDEREAPDQRRDAAVEGVPGADNAGGHGAAGSSEISEGDDPEEALAEELGAPVGNAGHEDAPGSARNEYHEVPAMAYFELRGFRPARRAIAHAMPPWYFRRLPLRSRKRYNPTRFVVVGAAGSGGANAHDPGASEAVSGPPPSTSLGLASAASRSAGVTVTASAGHGDNSEAMGSMASSELDSSSCDDRKSGSESNHTGAAEASSSCRLPSRSRKQRRPDHFVSESEEAEAAARAKVRRGDIVLDRFLSYMVRTSPEQRPEWVRDVTADGVGVQGRRGNNVSGTVTGSATILTVVAILGASMALSLVACLLFYIVGQGTSSGK